MFIKLNLLIIMTPNLFYLDKETKVGKVDKGLVISQQFLSFYKHNTIDGEDLRPAGIFICTSARTRVMAVYSILSAV